MVSTSAPNRGGHQTQAAQTDQAARFVARLYGSPFETACMKLALLSDLHANRQATEAVWAHARAQGYDQLVMLGDYVDYGADPVWVTEFVQARHAEGAIALRGNHDDALHANTTSQMSGHVLPSLEWTRQQMSALHTHWLTQLPLTAELGPCLLAHANVYDPAHWEYVQGRTEAMRNLASCRQQYVFCGHIHQQGLFHLSGTGKTGEFQPVNGVPIALSPARRWLGIPGSVGQPRDGNPAACYATFDVALGELTFFRVPYDHDTAAQRVIDAGLSPALARRLIHGE
jgi:diadenosine tetraphosphatase ApaH/serine/threonine PP2A family protein phosphatase